MMTDERLTALEAEHASDSLARKTKRLRTNSGKKPGRRVKVQQKSAGALRSAPGVRAFSRIRGDLSTLRKQGHSRLETLGAPGAGHTLPALSPT